MNQGPKNMGDCFMKKKPRVEISRHCPFKQHSSGAIRCVITAHEDGL
jgi:hypothetical protein